MCDVDARWNLADNDAGLYDSCRPINSEGRSSLVIIMKFLPYWLRENIALIMYIDRWRKCEEIMAWCMVYFECDDGRWFISQRRISIKSCVSWHIYTLREYHSYLTVTHILWYSGSLGSQSVPRYISTHHLDGICAVPELNSRMTNIMIRLQKTGPKSKKNRGK